jgi:putative hydrolase of the HAD superfamily
MRNSIECISFDVWKTLIKSNPEFKPKRDEVIADIVGIDDIKMVSSAIRQADISADERTDSTGFQYGPGDRLALAFNNLGLRAEPKDIEAYSRTIQDLFLEYPVMPNEPHILEHLKVLRSRYRGMYILSNTGFINGSYMREALGNMGIMEFMDKAFFSNEERVAKPSTDFFQSVINEAPVEAPKILHVGDNIQADYYGALGAGMQALLLSEKGLQGIEFAPTIGEAIENGVL